MKPRWRGSTRGRADVAWMKSIDVTCACGRRATHEVFNNRNGSEGRYCRACAAAKVQQLARAEHAARAAAV